MEKARFLAVGEVAISKLEAKKLLMKSKIYKMIALIFAIVGFFLFSYLFSQNSPGGIWEAFRNPFVVVVIVFPFIPSIIFAAMARRVEIKLNKVFTEIED